MVPSNYLKRCWLKTVGPLGTNVSEIWFKKIQLKMVSEKWKPFCPCLSVLTHWGWVTHIWKSNITIIGWDNDLPPGRCQAIIWTNAGIVLTGRLGTNFREMLIKIYIFSIKKMHFRMLFVKYLPFCLCLNVLMLSLWADYTHLCMFPVYCRTW